MSTLRPRVSSPTRAEPAGEPELSVLIATFNRAGALKRCLAALRAQSAPAASFEIVVVDDGSVDETPSLLAELAQTLPLRYQSQENRGQPAALNRAITLARGRISLFLDDDIIAGPDLVAAHLAGHDQEDLCVGYLGLQAPPRAGGLVTHLAQRWRRHYERLDSGESSPSFWDCYGGNLSAPTVALRAVGGFDETLRRSSDAELAFRLVEHGLTPKYLPAARAEQHFDKGFDALVRDFDAAGYAAIQMWKRHPSLIRFPPLGDFVQAGRSGLILRRLLLTLRMPVWPLRVLDPLLRHRPPERVYLFLQRYCYWRSARRSLHGDDTWARLTRPPLVLMYHAVGRREEAASRYVIPRRRLAMQFGWLRLIRYRVLTLDQFVDHLESGELPPARSVVITFDDGYLDNLTLALPLLRRYGHAASVFVVSGAVGSTNLWAEGSALFERPLLNWDGVRQLHNSGVQIGAHTVEHVALTELSPAAAAAEIAESGAQIAEAVGAPVPHFAFPYGKTSPDLQRAVAKAGYRSALGITPGLHGLAVSRYNVRRLEIHGDWGLVRFALALWLGFPVV